MPIAEVPDDTATAAPESGALAVLGALVPLVWPRALAMVQQPGAARHSASVILTAGCPACLKWMYVLAFSR